MTHSVEAKKLKKYLHVLSWFKAKFDIYNLILKWSEFCWCRKLQ
jgi:hypothetical protein